ncbi:hypothetical protein BCR44DRAFT_1443537, partial [Catenaria anguillulae PL171]
LHVELILLVNTFHNHAHDQSAAAAIWPSQASHCTLCPLGRPLIQNVCSAVSGHDRIRIRTRYPPAHAPLAHLRSACDQGRSHAPPRCGPHVGHSRR